MLAFSIVEHKSFHVVIKKIYFFFALRYRWDQQKLLTENYLVEKVK